MNGGVEVSDLKAMEKRTLDWSAHRQKMDSEYNIRAANERMVALQSFYKLVGFVIPIDDLCVVIADYVIHSHNGFVARLQMLELLRGGVDRKSAHKSVENLFNNCDNDHEFCDIAAQIMDFDPCDTSGWQHGEPDVMVYNDRRHQRFEMVFRDCDGCRTSLFCEIKIPNYRYSRGITWSKVFHPSGAFKGCLAILCNFCQDFCACATSPKNITLYSPTCKICDKRRCNIHNFKQSSIMFKQFSDEGRCDDCLEQLRLGQCMIDILKQKDPLDTFAKFLSSSKPPPQSALSNPPPKSSPSFNPSHLALSQFISSSKPNKDHL